MVLTGCEIAVPGRSPAPVPGAAAPASGEDTDQDTGLLEQVLGAVDSTSATVAAALARHRGLASSLQPLVDLHAAHRGVLDEAAQVPPPAAAAGSVPGAPAAALALVRRTEEHLAGLLRRAAVAARSGDLARVLASMSAGVGQHAAVLGGGSPQ